MSTRVIFPYAEQANGHIQYPDAIEMFANTDIHSIAGHIIADYLGELALIPYVPSSLPVLIVTKVDSDNPADTTVDLSAGEITCPMGTTLTITAELRQGSDIVPIDGSFNMPTQQEGGRKGMLKAILAAGIASVRAPFTGPSDDGRWTVDQTAINSGLAPEKHMAFAGVAVNVHR